MASEQLYQGIRDGNRLALAKAISLVEKRHPDCESLLGKLFKYTGKAHIIGITGPPGSGKSTLIDCLSKVLREKKKSLGIIAIDPTSPFTGGALLGDRIRMTRHTDDQHIFIRSMGTRGYAGGLARATSDVIKLMDAFGKDIIIVETVGTGQSEVDIVEHVHSTVVVAIPGMGDDIQVIKAGLFEIADIFVVNKADRDDYQKTVHEFRTMLEMNTRQTNKWNIPVLKTIAINNEGMNTLVSSLEKHYDYLKKENLLTAKQQKRALNDFQAILKEKLYHWCLERIGEEQQKLLNDLKIQKIDPFSLATQFIAKLK